MGRLLGYQGGRLVRQDQERKGKVRVFGWLEQYTNFGWDVLGRGAARTEETSRFRLNS